MHGIQSWTQRFMIWPVVGDNDTATTRANLRQKDEATCEICQMAKTCTSWDGSEHVQQSERGPGHLNAFSKEATSTYFGVFQTAWTILKRMHRAAKLPDQGQAVGSHDERNAPVPPSRGVTSREKIHHWVLQNTDVHS